MSQTSLKEPESGAIDISVIVPVYEHWDLIPGLLQAMRNQTLDSSQWELILVDNGSTQVPDSRNFPGFVQLLRCDTPGSYAARNMGLEHARGALIVFTDADCRPCKEWLEVHHEFFKSARGGVLQAGAIKVACLHAETPNRYELYDMALGLPQEHYARNRGYAITANLAIPRRVFDAVGRFDDKRFSGGDAEFCQRAVSQGHEVAYLCEARVLHPARCSWEDLATKARRVKGGQVRNGPMSRRLQFLVRTYLPPAFSFLRLAKKENFSMKEKSIVFFLLLRLWGCEMAEVTRLLVGKRPERR